MLLVIVLFVFPLVVLILRAGAERWEYPNLIPEVFSRRTISYLSDQAPAVFRSLLSSLGFSAAVVVMTFLLTFLPARMFSMEDFRGKVILESLLLLPAVIPPMTFAAGAHVMFIFLSLEDSWFGVVCILSSFSYPYMLRSLTAGFKAAGIEYSRCAGNLGAGFIRRTVFVEIPVLLPSIAAGSVIVFLVSFSEYFLVFLVAGGSVPAVTSFMVPLLRSGDFTAASGLVLIFLAFPMVLLFLLKDLLKRMYAKRNIHA
jgi:ABC-type spermidine/putrescine transport system permease subunit II